MPARRIPAADDSRRRQQPHWLRLHHLRRRRAAHSAHAAEVWQTFVLAHDGDTGAALGELVVVLLEAGMIASERQW